MIKEAIVQSVNREDLSYATAEAVMDEIMSGKASEIQMSAFLTAMSMKGETIEEITAAAAGMWKHCIRILHDMDVLEIVGTGGDKSNSFNISTMSALVISATEIPVAKHGNRAASSKSGAADVLESLGVNITVPPEKSLELLKTINLCFLYAQNYHLSMKFVGPVRKELGIRMIFNILGPLVNTLAREKNIDAKLLAGDVAYIPLENKYANYIKNRFAFHHYLDKEKAVKEIYRVLKAKGALSILNLNHEYMRYS
jgi:anthranilate phosphoribosyltransferase